jgi:soluble lytic murein transglycosylase-like protein
MRLTVVGMIVGSLLVAAHPAHGAVFPSTYDKAIRQAAERWLPGIPWKLLKAQLYQESRLDPAARSPAGAQGIAQFMGPTWQEVSQALGYHAIPRSAAEPSIDAAAYYMAQVKKRWASAELERHKFGLAAYNAGGGNIGRAARLCGDPPAWASVVPCLDDVTGRHSTETIGYVERIWTYWALMESSR